MCIVSDLLRNPTVNCFGFELKSDMQEQFSLCDFVSAILFALIV